MRSTQIAVVSKLMRMGPRGLWVFIRREGRTSNDEALVPTEFDRILLHGRLGILGAQPHGMPYADNRVVEAPTVVFKPEIFGRCYTTLMGR